MALASGLPWPGVCQEGDEEWVPGKEQVTAAPGALLNCSSELSCLGPRTNREAINLSSRGGGGAAGGLGEESTSPSTLGPSSAQHLPVREPTASDEVRTVRAGSWGALLAPLLSGSCSGR